MAENRDGSEGVKAAKRFPLPSLPMTTPWQGVLSRSYITVQVSIVARPDGVGSISGLGLWSTACWQELMSAVAAVFAFGGLVEQTAAECLVI